MEDSKHNPAATNQLEYFASESTELNQETPVQLSGLVDLLVELNFIEETEKLTDKLNSAPENYISITDNEQQDLNNFNANTNYLQFSQLLLPPALEKPTSELTTTPENTVDPEISKSSASLLEHYGEKIEDLYDAYKSLQVLLLEPELAGLQEIIANFAQKINVLEEEVNQPQHLINLALPIIPEIIERKIAESEESKESLINSLLPIIDLMILAKTKENRESMGIAIADAIPVAISEEIKQYPQEISRAIAPEIAEAIKEQIKLDPEAMVSALYPIIHQIIDSKTSEDKEALSVAIAPLLPPAISQQIRQSPEEIAQAIAPEMAAAIREQMRIDQDVIAKTLAPQMGKAIKEQIVIERDAMVDALYPVIGSTISKYMADAIRSINEKVETAISLQGINRKIRAKIQGVSEAELILKEAIPFSVRAGFLIHKRSGLVLADTQPENKPRLESEMVAGMLTAIRSFVNDCIAQTGDVSEIDSIDYGNSKIILEVAGYCYLAVVTQGTTPQWYIRKIQHSLYQIVQVAGKQIESYEGDPSTIPEQVNQILEQLIKLSQKSSQGKGFQPPGLLVVACVVLGLIVLPWGYFQYRQGIDRQIETETMEALASAPELSVYRLDAKMRDGKLQLSGRVPNPYYRAKAEEIVKKTAPTQTLENKIIAVEVPPDPMIVAAEVKRVTSNWNQVNGIAISSRYADDKVIVDGKVPQITDGNKITAAFKQIPGVKAVTNTVQVQPSAIATRIYFDLGSTELKAVNKNQILQIKALLNQYPELSLRIMGYSDPTGDSNTNLQLAQLRAETVRNALINQGIEPKRLQALATPMPPLGVDSGQPLWLSRCVEFQPVVLRKQGK